jgi:hypothetical protein
VFPLPSLSTGIDRWLVVSYFLDMHGCGCGPKIFSLKQNCHHWLLLCFYCAVVAALLASTHKETLSFFSRS